MSNKNYEIEYTDELDFLDDKMEMEFLFKVEYNESHGWYYIREHEKNGERFGTPTDKVFYTKDEVNEYAYSYIDTDIKFKYINELEDNYDLSYDEISKLLDQRELAFSKTETKIAIDRIEMELIELFDMYNSRFDEEIKKVLNLDKYKLENNKNVRKLYSYYNLEYNYNVHQSMAILTYIKVEESDENVELHKLYDVVIEECTIYLDEYYKNEFDLLNAKYFELAEKYTMYGGATEFSHSEFEEWTSEYLHNYYKYHKRFDEDGEVLSDYNLVIENLSDVKKALKEVELNQINLRNEEQ